MCKMSFQYSLCLFLKMFRDGASTVVAGRWFQLFMTRCENDFPLTNTIAGFFRTFFAVSSGHRNLGWRKQLHLTYPNRVVHNFLHKDHLTSSSPINQRGNFQFLKSLFISYIFYCYYHFSCSVLNLLQHFKHDPKQLEFNTLNRLLYIWLIY